MESENGAFLSGFTNYYSVLTGDDHLSCYIPETGRGEWSEVVDIVTTTAEQQPFQYLDYYEPIVSEDSSLDIVTIHALGEIDSTTGSIITSSNMANDYFTLSADQMGIQLPIPDLGTTALDLDYLNESCPFDWDLNLENLLTTKTDLPDLTPLCNDICSEFVGESSEILSAHHGQIENGEHTSVSSGSDTKPSFQCSYEQCRKVYAKAAHLRSHLRRHLGEKPYICTWQNCQWRFNRSDELARHRRSHSGMKPYPCDYCSKRFSRSDHLAKHRKVHERKFASGKAKGVWKVLPKAKPGRKPKALKQLEEQGNNFSY